MIRVVRIAELPHDTRRLRDEADRDGVRNMALLVERWRNGAERFDGPGEALFGAFDGNALVGVGGVTRETAVPAMRMRRLYMLKAHRKLGAGRLLAEAMIAKGFEGVERLTCNTRATAQAAPFWEAMGFSRVDAPTWTHERT